MATTTNYGWTTPDDTALVKDGAAAIRSLGTAIDTTVFNNAGAAIAKTIVDAKGDIIAATAADTIARLAVGANDTVLTADSSTATGLKWAAAGGAGANWSLHNAGGTALTGAQTITVSGISNKDKIMVLIKNASSVNASRSDIRVRLNTDTGNNYYRFGGSLEGLNTYSSAYLGHEGGGARDGILAGQTGNNALSAVSGCVVFTGCASAGVKQFTVVGSSDYAEQVGVFAGGYYDSATTISSVSLFSEDGNFDAGTLFVYTSA